MPSIDEPRRSVEILVRVSHRRMEAGTQRGRRADFWQPFVQSALRQQPQGIPEGFLTDDLLESRLISGFGGALKGYLDSLAPRSIVNQEAQRKAALAAGLVVRARILGYSSLDLGVSIEPIKNLVELFDGNFEYFSAFLSTYIPAAFQASLGSYGVYFGSWDDVGAQLDFAIGNPAVIAADFTSANRSHTDRTRAAQGAIDKARWLWILSNTSLVVPTVLAAWYLYGVSKELEVRQRSVDESFKTLAKAQQGLVQTLLSERQQTRQPDGSETRAAPKGQDVPPTR